MLYSNYIKNKDIPYFDEQVSLIISGYPMEGGGKDMIIGIHNFKGEIYRILRATGMGAYLYITRELAEIGLEDELSSALYGKDGFDSIFVTTKDMQISQASIPVEAKPNVLDDIESVAPNLVDYSETERTTIIQSRLGQGLFREKLINYWRECAVMDCNFAPLLKASHIKPWRDSSDIERLDVYNGLLLSPQLDAAFDSGYISFDDSGKIIFSPLFDSQHAYSLRITQKLRIKSKLLTAEHRQYLEYHRTYVLRQN